MNCVRKHLSGDQGRPAGRRRRARARGDAGDQRRARRRPGGDRLRPHRARSHHLRRRPRASSRATASAVARGRRPPGARRTTKRQSPAACRNAEFRLIATPMHGAAPGGRDTARGLGLTPLILGDALEGEARETGHRAWPASPAASARHGQPLPPPAVLLSGGETTVTIGARPRRPRRPQHRVPARRSPWRLRGAPGIWAVAGDTDGIDGTEDAAGAISRPTRWPARAPQGSTRAPCWPGMTATRCSTRSAI